jgi:hypothetical protein
MPERVRGHPTPAAGERVRPIDPGFGRGRAHDVVDLHPGHGPAMVWH